MIVTIKLITSGTVLTFQKWDWHMLFVAIITLVPQVKEHAFYVHDYTYKHHLY